MLTKTNYAEWSMVMKVKMQAQRMWDAVRYGDANFDENRRALEALLAAVPMEMHSSLTNKRTAKDTWDAFTAARIGSARARRSTLQKLRQEWENLGFQLLARYGDNNIGEERVVEKFLCVIPKKYSQVAIVIEMLLDFSELSIEEVTGHLKAVDNHEQLPPSELVTIGGKLLFTKEQWLAHLVGAKEGGGLGFFSFEFIEQPQASAAQEGDELALFYVHGSIEPHSSPAPAAIALHLDEPRAHVFLSNESDDDKIDGWYLDTGATHHMTGRREFFFELDSGVRGSVKFGDASAVEIKGVGSAIFTAKTGEHRLLTGVYYIPVLRNSIISLGQLDEMARAWRSSTGSCVSRIAVIAFSSR
ncbi:uncharacterized protein [Miscanthus floridulus]|uniref:uncharacterized protein n=1 Tax=Miscanthus floridulus TaxID=154761 RepID=UPI00345A5A72